MPTARATITPALPSTTSSVPTRIALYGDGLIDGDGLPDAQSLPDLLAAAHPDLQILDLGLGSESSDKVLTRDRDATEQRLAAAVIWVGTYDPAAGNSAQQYAQNMAHLVDDFKGTDLILLPPVTLPGGRSAAPYAAALQQVASQRNLAVTDIAAPMQHADWKSDGRRLGPNADAALATLLGTALATVHGTVAPPAGKRVVLIGDSLSYGAELDPPHDLPSVLRSLRPDLDVIDTAVGGQQSSDALSRIRQFRLLHADEVVVWLGTQDADDATPISDFRDNLSRLVAALAPARVILVTPVADYSADPRAFLPYAAATRQLAGQLGAGLIELGDLPRSQYLEDSVHLDAATDARIAAQYAELL